MRHTDQRHMLDEMLEAPDDLVVESRNRRAALYVRENGDAVLVQGDLDGPPEEVDDRIQRFAKQMKTTQHVKKYPRK